MLELRGLSRSYGDVLALDNVSFTVGEGQMFGFIGPNGAGKTTAMRIILGVLEPDQGEVRWRGRLMDDQIRRRVGYMPEDHGQTFLQQCADAWLTSASEPTA
jgi:ABC-2 type transport system ATP-binding protein